MRREVMTELKEAVKTGSAPAAIGPYSQAIRAGEWVFCSGQIPLDPETGKMIDGGVREQTRKVLENLRAVLQAAGLDFRNVVKTTVYMTDLGKFAEMNEVYAEAFKGIESYPARAAVGVVALPKGVQVEIEAVARKG